MASQGKDYEQPYQRQNTPNQSDKYLFPYGLLTTGKSPYLRAVDEVNGQIFAGQTIAHVRKKPGFT